MGKYTNKSNAKWFFNNFVNFQIMSIKCYKREKPLEFREAFL